MIHSIQNYNYDQTFTGSIKKNPAIRAVEKHLKKVSKEVRQCEALEFFNFIQKIKNDNTNNLLIVTTSQRALDTPASVEIKTGSKTISKTIHKHTVTKVKYGNIVREYNEEIYDLPKFKPDLARTIKHNLVNFGKELFGKRCLTKLTTENLRQCNTSYQKASKLHNEAEEILEQIKQLDRTNLKDYIVQHNKLVNRLGNKQKKASEAICESTNFQNKAEEELQELTLNLLK